MYSEVKVEMAGLLADGKYVEGLQVMLKMKQPVDGFFDQVMVMAEDTAVRQNRLNLLTAIGELVMQIADISKIQDTQA
jgi:glycyl-tRNA synthetase beta chain